MSQFRYAPEIDLPPYAYVPGRSPHPVSNPAGHSFGKPVEPATCPPQEAWRESSEYRYGIDLFNRGYYWEAHEAWEAVWRGCERQSAAAEFLKGLIKLAAAGVKAREGRPEGVRRHAARAAELFALVQSRLDPATARYFGLSFADLLAAAAQAKEAATLPDATADVPVKIVFPFQLRPV